TFVGRLTKEMEKEVGFNLDIVQAASHDTASAVVSVPAEEKDFLYISSGTWSLMGVEREEADYSEESRIHNFTNEGGYEYRYRYLKNIMGLWMQQSVKKEYENKYSYNELWEMAEKSGFGVTIDANDERLLAPESMIQTIQELCKEKGEKIPETPGEVVNVIAHSLAECYKKTAEEIEALTGKKYPVLHIVGGGSQADYLCRLTAKATGKKVLAGPMEGTAVGNLVVQMIRDKSYRNIHEARKAVGESFEVKKYLPE
ncbi:MAG: rhamnulokinase, partial [Lachnospiraceae bacterium]|nr:rhamnulokinase [Lachnospiraceae bacterium]